MPYNDDYSQAVMGLYTHNWILPNTMQRFALNLIAKFAGQIGGFSTANCRKHLLLLFVHRCMAQKTGCCSERIHCGEATYAFLE